MPPNGHALRLDEVEPTEKSDTATPIEITPAATAAPTKPITIDVDVGNVAANAAVWVCCGLGEYQASGRLTVQTRATGGERLAPLAMALLAYTGSDDDFYRRARGAARRALRQYFDDNFLAAHVPEGVDAAIELALDGTFEIVDRVVTAERLHRAAHAN
jgi:hypothetical protein